MEERRINPSLNRGTLKLNVERLPNQDFLATNSTQKKHITVQQNLEKATASVDFEVSPQIDIVFTLMFRRLNQLQSNCSVYIL